MEYVERDIWDGASDDDPAVAKYHRPLDAKIFKLKKENKELIKQVNRFAEENQSLKKFIQQHGLSMITQASSYLPQTLAILNTVASAQQVSSPLPNLPPELQFRILRFAMKLMHPVIDHGVKLQQAHITQTEALEQKSIPMDFLLACKSFYSEGTKLLLSSNELIFTQPAALQKFGCLPHEVRRLVKHVTLRIVGRHYDDNGYTIGMGWYHKDVRDLHVQFIRRCPSLNPRWNGLQSYCWRQIFDFLSEFCLTGREQFEKRLFPVLKSIRIDLVNFSQELPGPGSRLRNLIRSTVGQIVDELFVRGIPINENGGLGMECLRGLVRDGGCYGQSRPAFVTEGDSLKNLQPHGHSMHLVNAGKARPKGEGEGEKLERFVWKSAPESFTGFPHNVMRFHINSGHCLVDIGCTEENFHTDSEDSEADDLDHHAYEIKDSEAEQIFGPDWDDGGGYIDHENGCSCSDCLWI